MDGVDSRFSPAISNCTMWNLILDLMRNLILDITLSRECNILGERAGEVADVV